MPIGSDLEPAKVRVAHIRIQMSEEDAAYFSCQDCPNKAGMFQPEMTYAQLLLDVLKQTVVACGHVSEVVHSIFDPLV